MQSKWRGSYLTILLALPACLTGCTVITIKDNSGRTEIHRQFGVVEVRLSATCGTSTSVIKSLGLTVTESGTTLGWSSGAGLVVREKC